MAKKVCPICGADAVPPYGPKEAKILIVSDVPDDTEVLWGIPLVGPIGDVLKKELSRLGLDMRQCRIACLAIHPLDRKSEHFDKCREFGLKVIHKELQNRKGILLLGKNCAEYFMGMGVMDISGLRVEADCKSIQTDVLVCCPNPGIVFKDRGVVGELRFALKNFIDGVDQWI